MADLSICDIDELEDRFQYLSRELDDKLKEAGPIIKSLGSIRQEMFLISEEIKRRERDG